MDHQGWAAPDSAPEGASGPLAAPLAPTSAGVPAAMAHAAPPRLPVPLRPMTLSDLLDGSFAVMKARPRTVFAIAGAVLVPAHAVASFLQRDFATSFSFTNALSAAGSGESTGVSDAAVLAAYAGQALLALALFFLGGAIGRLVTAWYAGGDLTAGEALAATFRRTPAILVAFSVLLVAKLLGVAACYVGMIAVVTLFNVTAPALVVEGLGPFAAAARSWKLVARRFWPCLGIVALASVGSQLLDTVIGGVPTLLVSLLPPPLDWVGAAAVSAGVSMIVTTALVSVSVLLYVDLRIRTEGLDIELDAADAFGRG